jgi:Kef-type K+ transport system membrane component KefB
MHSTTELLFGLAVVWVAAKLAGEAMERLGQTAVLGELLAGVLIGPGVLGVAQPSETLHALAELGVIILLFEIGLQSDLDDLMRVGIQSTVVALAGVACPLVLGWALGRAWGLPALTAIFIGATLTATSVGITARVLADLGRLHDPASRIVLGAAVVDDVLGLVILAVVTGLSGAERFSSTGVVLVLAKAVFFLVAAVLLGIRLAPTFLVWVGRMRTRGSLIVAALVFCVLLAAFFERIGLAAIVGAFAAGLILARTERRAHIEAAVNPVADVLVPIFFVLVGMQVAPAALNPAGPSGWGGLVLTVLLIAVAVVSKLLAGLGVYTPDVGRFSVGVGMVPRGEVGLIFAGTGLAAQIIDQDLYATLVTTVMVSTLIVPPWLKAVYGPPRKRDEAGRAE